MSGRIKHRGRNRQTTTGPIPQTPADVNFIAAAQYHDETSLAITFAQDVTPSSGDYANLEALDDLGDVIATMDASLARLHGTTFAVNFTAAVADVKRVRWLTAPPGYTSNGADFAATGGCPVHGQYVAP